jgi:hypothetical protein
MVAQRKNVFIGLSILWLAIACQGPSAPPTVTGNDLALTVTSLVQTLTGQPAITPVLINTLPPPTEVLPMVTQPPTAVPPTATSALSMVIVDSGGVPVDTNPSQPQPATAVSTALPAVPTMPQFGSISGNVQFKDLYATPVPVQGINITVKAGATRLETQSDRFGEYFVSNVPVGLVIIEFKYSIYLTQKLTNVIVESGLPVRAPDFYVKPIVPHENPTPCTTFLCTFPTLETHP